MMTQNTLSVSYNQRLISKYQLVEVTLHDEIIFGGRVLNVDGPSDIAIVKISYETPLPEAKFGSSSGLCPGDWVLYISRPHTLKNTVTVGIVSCVDCKSSDLGFSGVTREYLQTNCAYALESSTALDWLQMLDLNEVFIAQLKTNASLPNVNKGILVTMVPPGSLGDRAGFRPDDVVIEFDGKPVESMEEVIEILGDKVGVPIKVLVKRASGESVTLTVIPEELNLDV
ncbi:putative protease Do 14 [Spatholobus suberectus]|nr:putative protease Do 14 [Spatholobus suberectus]